MKALQVLLAIVVLVGFATTTRAMSFPDRNPGVTVEAKLNCPYVPTNGGRVFLQIMVAANGIAPPLREHRPMNISVVLDRSGSMADERKMEYAKSALSKLIDQLGGEDIFSLVVYDDVVNVLRPAGRVGNRQDLKRLISDVYPRNSTNLGGGMMEGLHQVERNLDREYVNRVILLSDGLANQGVTDPRELNRIARRYREKSISLTTMGVGLDYNENLMAGLAESGGGNYYFIESPARLASIMHSEFKTLSSVIAQNASINLRPGAGVSVLDVIGCEHPVQGDTYNIPIGDLYAGETREFTVELELPSGTGTRVVATGSVNSESGNGRSGLCVPFSALVHYTGDVTAIQRNRDLETQAKADVAVSTRNVEKALKAVDEGRTDDARKELRAATQMLSASPAASAGGAGASAVQEQASRLQSFSKSLDGDDLRKAKKAIQYENYKVQKKK